MSPVDAIEAATADRYNAFISVEEAAPSAGTGPLAGVPLAVKDLIDHAGRVTTAGSAFYRNQAFSTAPSLQRLIDAGAVVVGRTGLHEFAFGFSSENPWFGPVLNPLDPRLSPGGSSGGSAAAVAAGIVPLAMGTDTGGSVRVPAALCSVIGLKPTHGLIPLEGVFPLVPSLDTVGAIGASLDMVALATDVMAGTDPDSTLVERLVVPTEWIESAPMSEPVATAFERFLLAADQAGFEVVRRSLPELVPSPLQGAVIGPEVAGIHGDWRRGGEQYGEDVGERIDHGLAVTQEQARQARAWREKVTGVMRSAAGGSLLVTPTVPNPTKFIGQDLIDGRHYRTVLSWFTALVNTTGCPALSLPLPGNGVRTSIQLIGDHGSEATLVNVGRLLGGRGIVISEALPYV